MDIKIGGHVMTGGRRRQDLAFRFKEITKYRFSYIITKVKETSTRSSLRMAMRESNDLYPATEIIYSRDHPASDPFLNGDALTPRNGEAGISRHDTGNQVAQCIRRHLDCWQLHHFHDTGATSSISTKHLRCKRQSPIAP